MDSAATAAAATTTTTAAAAASPESHSDVPLTRSISVELQRPDDDNSSSSQSGRRRGAPMTPVSDRWLHHPPELVQIPTSPPILSSDNDENQYGEFVLSDEDNVDRFWMEAVETEEMESIEVEAGDGIEDDDEEEEEEDEDVMIDRTIAAIQAASSNETDDPMSPQSLKSKLQQKQQQRPKNSPKKKFLLRKQLQPKKSPKQQKSPKKQEPKSPKSPNISAAAAAAKVASLSPTPGSTQLEEADDMEGEDADDEGENKRSRAKKKRSFTAPLIALSLSGGGGGDRRSAAMMTEGDKAFRGSTASGAGGGGARKEGGARRNSLNNVVPTAPIFRYIRNLAAGRVFIPGSSGVIRVNRHGEVVSVEDDNNNNNPNEHHRHHHHHHPVDSTEGNDNSAPMRIPDGTGEEEDDGISSSGSFKVADQVDDDDDVDGDSSVMEDDDEDESQFNSWDESSLAELEVKNRGPPDVFDWETLSVLPNRFCCTSTPTAANMLQTMTQLQKQQHTSSTIPYLDSAMWQQSSSLTKAEAHRFVWEHGLLLQAVLQLLAEREHVGVEGSPDAVDNIWKKGPLKKMSFAVSARGKVMRASWSVKYVELRKGNLTYYEDSGDQGRKTIHLRQTEATVQESTQLQRGDGFVFELLIPGYPTRFWMARSDEERQAWIKAIQAAMIGDEDRRPRVLDVTPYQNSIRMYSELREAIQNAQMQESYMEAIQQVAEGKEALQIPVQWMREQLPQTTEPVASNLGSSKRPQMMKKKNSAPDRLFKNSISEFWKSMRQVSFSVNGFMVPRSSPVAAERVVGSLTRCILEFDKAASLDGGISPNKYEISELQAVSYARSILLSVLQGKDQEDCENAVNYLLQGRPELVRVSKALEDEMDSLARLEISFVGEDLPDDFMEELDVEQDMSSWIQLARRKNSSSSVPRSRWRKRYVVVSGAVLSFYESAYPRPHGLRGQFVLSVDATIKVEELPREGSSSLSGTSSHTRLDQPVFVAPKVDRPLVICISTPGQQDCLLQFDDVSDLEVWADYLQEQKESLESRSVAVTEDTDAGMRRPNPSPTSSMTPGKMFKGAERVIKGAADSSIRVGGRVIKGATDSGIKAMKIATDGSMKVMKIATDNSMKVLRGAVGRLNAVRGGPVLGARLGLGSLTRPRPSRGASVQSLMNDATVPGKREPSVQCVAQRTSTFVIRAARVAKPVSDPLNNNTNTINNNTTEDDLDADDDDHWTSVQVTWYQAFVMSGGRSGRLNMGDVLVELDFLNKDEIIEEDDDVWVGELEVL